MHFGGNRRWTSGRGRTGEKPMNRFRRRVRAKRQPAAEGRQDSTSKNPTTTVAGALARPETNTAEFLLQLWKHQRHAGVHGFRMARGVVRIMRQCTERERQFVHVARVTNEGLDEVAGPDVVQEVAEELVAERVVAKILDYRAAVGERPGTKEIVGG